MTKNLSTNNDLSTVLYAISEFTDEPVVFGGGGKGQTASVVWEGRTVTAKATSRLQAAADLLEIVTLRDLKSIDEPEELGRIEEIEAEEAKTVERISDDDAIRFVLEAFGNKSTVVFDRDPEDEDQFVGPVWDGTTLVSLTPCVAECMAGEQDYCECRCDGANHGIGSGSVFAALGFAGDDEDAVLAAIQSVRPTTLGPKECLCGCGGTTQRRFVPGHDARHHGLLNAQKYAAENGIGYSDEDELRKVVNRAKAAARRVAKRAATKTA